MTTVLKMPFDKRISVGAELGSFGVVEDIVVDVGLAYWRWDHEDECDRIASLLRPWPDGSCGQVRSLCLHGGGVAEAILHELCRLGCGPKLTRLVIKGQQGSLPFSSFVTFLLFTLTLLHARVRVYRDTFLPI